MCDNLGFMIERSFILVMHSQTVSTDQVVIEVMAFGAKMRTDAVTE